MYRRLSLTGILVVILAAAVHAGSTDPITGARFDSLIAAQNTELQQHLESFFPESDGYFVTGPLDPFYAGDEDVELLYHTVRVICPDVQRLEETIIYAKSAKFFDNVREWIDDARSSDPDGYRGAIASMNWQGNEFKVQLNTVQQTRWLIWAQETLLNENLDVNRKRLRRYAEAVSDYLYEIDRGNRDAEAPQASEFDLPSNVDLYAPPPPYVIEGYENYKAFLHDHASISTEFAHGVLAFMPNDSLLDVLKAIAPTAAYPNKEEPMLQHEYRKFFARGGDPLVIHTLTPQSLQSLQAGEYFFAVGLDNTIRYGRELLREEVERIERETGQKVPRANHAFLFPGEPILTAGAFFVEGESHARIAHVNAHSGHYFYSNVTPTIREDIAERSDDYLLTLGHLFRALDRLGIPYDSVLVSKM